MKHLLTLIAAALLLGLCACRTTEANYRAAYEKTKEQQNAGLSREEIEGFAREENTHNVTRNGDTIPLRGVYVNTVVEGGIDKPALRYNVVLAYFTQRFNANSAIGRVRQAGLDRACLLIDRDKKYYVSAYNSNDLDSALTMLYQIKAHPPIGLRAPYPYILEKPGVH